MKGRPIRLLESTLGSVHRAARRWRRPVGRLGWAGRLAPSATAAFVADRFLRPPRTGPSRPSEVAFAASLRPMDLDPDLFVAERGDGPPVLFVHGWGYRGTRLFALAEAAIGSGRRAVVVDLPGHGRSRGGAVDPERAASALLRVGQALGPFAGIVGHSFGGAVAALAGARGFPASRIVMIGSPTAYDRVFDRVLERLGLEDPKLRQRAHAQLERSIGIPPARISVERTVASAGDRRLLVVHDPEDDEVPFEDALRNARVWPGAELLRVENAGHRRILERPDVHAAVIAFLGAG